MFKSLFAVIILCLIFLSVGRSNATTFGQHTSSIVEDETLDQEPSTPALESKRCRILFLGNSHSANHNIAGLVESILRDAAPEKDIDCHLKTAGFLDFFVADTKLMHSLKDGTWDYVVLQGQKISMSGKYSYSTKEAAEIAAICFEGKTKVVWFAEWSRKDVEGERERILKIYCDLAKTNNDIVATIGNAWELSLAEKPKLKLHSADGNHANKVGALLTAFVLASNIATADARRFNDVPKLEIDAETQAFLKTIAWKTQHDAKKDSAGQKNSSPETSINK